MEKTIEIPFGAKDSELNGWEYTIPENMEAEIKDGKIIVKQKESEDERIREQIEQAIIEHDWSITYKVSKDDCLAYLERQKEQQPAEWSEADKNRLDNLCRIIDDSNWNEASKYGFKHFLKSLRPAWKPSEEQLCALKKSIEYLMEYGISDDDLVLNTLYNDIKKL